MSNADQEKIQQAMQAAAERIIDGRSWDEFCDELKAIGHDVILADTSPTSLLDRAEGWRYLARLTRASLQSFLDPSPKEKPEFTAVVGVSNVKMGMDNPDNVYTTARIDGRGTYRIRGKRNTVHFLGFGSQAGGYGKTGNLATTGSLDASNIEVDADGYFDIIASAEQQAGNWLPLSEASNMIQARQSFGDRNREQLAELSIERIDIDESAPDFNPLMIDWGLKSAAAMVRGTSSKFAEWAEWFKAHPNELPRFDPDIAYAAGGDPKIAYYHSYFELGEDQALVVTLRPPECEYWNFQLANYWLESLDYKNHQIHINSITASYNDDGSVTAIVAHRDPGLPNWLNTTGHLSGTMCARWLGASEHPVPETKVVDFASLVKKS